MDGVPEFASPDHASFEILPSGIPFLLLDVDAGTLQQLPLPTTDERDPERAASLADWQLISRTSSIIVDGPGEHGFLVGSPTDLSASAAWASAASAFGGATVFFRRSPAADDLPYVRVRGGFVRLVGSADNSA
jgi:hypothetical protein